VQGGTEEKMACYKEICEEKKQVTVQSSLGEFVRKIGTPAPSTS
jgi:hypothetical protein